MSNNVENRTDNCCYRPLNPKTRAFLYGLSALAIAAVAGAIIGTFSHTALMKGIIGGVAGLAVIVIALRYKYSNSDPAIKWLEENQFQRNGDIWVKKLPLTDRGGGVQYKVYAPKSLEIDTKDDVNGRLEIVGTLVIAKFKTEEPVPSFRPNHGDAIPQPIPPVSANAPSPAPAPKPITNSPSKPKVLNKMESRKWLRDNGYQSLGDEDCWLKRFSSETELQRAVDQATALNAKRVINKNQEYTLKIILN